jgi:hypothetical protein
MATLVTMVEDATVWCGAHVLHSHETSTLVFSHLLCHCCSCAVYFSYPVETCC